MRVRHLLRNMEFQGGMRHAPLVAQFSSMGSITPKWLEEFQHSFWQGSSHEPGQPASESLLKAPPANHGLHRISPPTYAAMHSTQTCGLLIPGAPAPALAEKAC